MSISSVKSEMLLPEQELIIGKQFELKGKPALITSITLQGGIIKLWIFQQIPKAVIAEAAEMEAVPCITNREEILRRTLQSRFGFKHISAITLQGISLPISRSSMSIVGHDPASYMKLQHFAEAGVNFSPIENVSFEELVLSEYQLAEGTAFPQIDTGTDIPVSLTLQEESVEVLIEPAHSFHLRTDVQLGGEAHSFRDPSDGREIVYSIDQIGCFDIWKGTQEHFLDEETIKVWREHGLDDTAIAQRKVHLQETTESLCPKGHEILVLQYECPDDLQLNFYTTDFLDSKPLHTGSCSSVGLIGSSADDSLHGHPVRSCQLKTVPKGFDEPVDVELISWYRRIPEERIEV